MWRKVYYGEIKMEREGVEREGGEKFALRCACHIMQKKNHYFIVAI